MSIASQLMTHAKALSILYVEDDKKIRAEIAEFLDRFFLTVDLADNGKEGLLKYKEKHYDIVITDLNMPVMGGIEMSKALKKKHPEQPIVIISAHNESEYLLELINIGVEHYVLKPIDMKSFAKALDVLAAHIYNTELFNKYHKNIEQDNERLAHKVTSTTAELKNQRNTDTLTGLQNLSALMSTLEEFEKMKDGFAVIILLDIRGFRSINDLYGPAAGNQVLIDLGDFLKRFAYDNTYRLYRISGDQFVLYEQTSYLDTDRYDDHLSELKTEINGLSIYLEKFDKEISLTMTIGMSFGQESPLEHANMALNNAKKNNKSHAVYNTTLDMTDEIKAQFAWQHKIDLAILSDQIIPVYQPIVDSSGNIVKYETLMRVIEEVDGEKRLIAPFHFLDIAIENRQYDTLSRMVILKALKGLAANDYSISINLTMDDINNKPFLDEIYNTIKKDKTEKRLIIEITESQSVENYRSLKDLVEKFKQLGIRFAIDDFGSGFSNFERILEIQPDYIKIDGSLIKDINTNTHTHILTNAITSFSHELGIKVIAEYVHSEEIFFILKQFGVDEFQGYYFSEPQIEINRASQIQ